MARTNGRRRGQLELAARGRRGGWRAGAGRKAKKPEERKGHWPRPALAARFPVHVTMKVLPTAPRLREGRCFRVIRGAFAGGKDRFGFRLTQFTVQGNHIHLICEARDREALSRGMQGLAIRLARRLNRRTGRSGKLFAERYHARILRTPPEVRRALAYVLCNSRRHGHPAGGRDWVDELSSARYFDGWSRSIRRWAVDTPECPVVRPSGWLLREGWRRCGLIRPDEQPARRAGSGISATRMDT